MGTIVSKITNCTETTTAIDATLSNNNTTFTVTRVDDNNFTITTAGTGTSVATGGGTGITALFSYAPLPTITISGGEAT